MNCFTFFEICELSRFRWASVNGVVLIRGSPLSGGWSGSRNPLPRWANHSLNVVYTMPIFRAAAFNNKNKYRVLVEQGPG